ncbi:CoA ester lyase [Curvibacter sp. HBC61]|uniref:CoA ester lyase n=1 Tax=Curvibacter cyanobacteriorum TaxID=3026422 RepID=A0ABT5N471_9BURK|nr:CoA ester lyase [Curvibacter sp. HBC61]MDD0839873.1 CoA ester lyase [Curvibacter sp. HBC61]
MRAPDRSYLFVPGNRPERFAKALQSGAHAVVLDLEDAVAPEQKEAARQALADWLPGGAPVYLRVNGSDTAWFDADCALLSAAAVRGVMLPKAQGVNELAALRARLRPEQTLIPLIETVLGWSRARTLAACPGVLRLAFGSVDFAADAGIRGDVEELASVRTELVLASRLAGLQAPVDGVSLALDDALQQAEEVARSRRFGFGAKLCVHPKQVAGVNQGFAPSPAERAWAQRVVDAVAQRGLGAIAVDGKLVDKPVLLLAEAVLAEPPAAAATA